MTSRSNCAKESRTLRVKRPIDVVVLNCCVIAECASSLSAVKSGGGARQEWLG
jgi:hypothetical protein